MAAATFGIEPRAGHVSIAAAGVQWDKPTRGYDPKIIGDMHNPHCGAPTNPLPPGGTLVGCERSTSLRRYSTTPQRKTQETQRKTRKNNTFYGGDHSPMIQQRYRGQRARAEPKCQKNNRSDACRCMRRGGRAPTVGLAPSARCRLRWHPLSKKCHWPALPPGRSRRSMFI